jgi:TolB-like protein/DNA-binding winged helix-turn-helix (wHTH) protein/tetratricopeptide (TPR) repeat protein
MSEGPIYHFGGFCLDPRSRSLLGPDGEHLGLTPKAFDALVLLVEHAGEVVSRRELIEALWPETVVEENNLSQLISAVRQVVGKDCIATRPGRGYQFVANVQRSARDTLQHGELPAPATATKPMARRPVGRAGFMSAAAALLLLGAVVGYLATQAHSRAGQSPASPGASGVPTLAVLPFTDLSADRELGTLADGISTELSTVLARIDPLQVTPASSSFALKGRQIDVREAGQLLGVRYLLEADLQGDGDRLRINVRLSDATTGFQVWNETYPDDGSSYFPRDAMFGVQDSIVRSVAQALQVKLGVGPIGTRLGMTRDSRALSEYEQAPDVNTLVQAANPDLLLEALGHLDKAVHIDENFSLAWLRMAQYYRTMREFNVPPAEQLTAVERGQQALERVRELTPDLPELLLVGPDDVRKPNGQIPSVDFLAMERVLEKYDAEALRQHYPLTELLNQRCVFLYFVGRLHAALPTLRQVWDVDPMSGQAAMMLMSNYAAAGDYQQAFRIADDHLHRMGKRLLLPTNRELQIALTSGDNSRIQRYLDWYEQESGPDDLNVRMGKLMNQPAQALVELQREFVAVGKLPPDQLMLHLQPMSAWAAYFGDPGLALQMQREFLAHGQGRVVEGFALMASLPIFSGMRQMDGFKELVTDVGLEKYWRESDNWADYCHPVDDTSFVCS